MSPRNTFSVVFKTLSVYVHAYNKYIFLCALEIIVLANYLNIWWNRTIFLGEGGRGGSHGMLVVGAQEDLLEMILLCISFKMVVKTNLYIICYFLSHVVLYLLMKYVTAGPSLLPCVDLPFALLDRYHVLLNIN